MNRGAWLGPALGTGLMGLLVALLAWAHSDPPWRTLQLEFQELEANHLRQQLAIEQERLWDRMTELDARVEAARQDIRPEAEAELEDALQALRARRRLAVERGQLQVDDPTFGPREVRREVEAFDALIEDHRSRLDALRHNLLLAEDQRRREMEAIHGLERRLETLDKAMPLGIQEIRPKALPESNGVATVDRCITCHLGMAPRDTDAPDLSDAEFPAPFDAHPVLHMGHATEHHAIRELGCTACHGGEGRSTDFSRTGHTPNNAAQAEDWKQRFDHRPDDGLGHPMLPKDRLEASCGACHTTPWVTGAPVLSAGRQRIQELGCGGCHRPTAGPPAPSTGISLVHIAERSTPDWVTRYLIAPRTVRSESRMPHLFGPTPVDDAGRRRQATEVRAVVAFLWDQSTPLDLPAAAPGDPEEGRRLFHAIGCHACHNEPADVGAGLEDRWIQAWLRNPKALDPAATMPDLHTTDREIAHLTAYLTAQEVPHDDGFELPAMDPDIRDRLVLEWLEQETTLEESAARLEAMDAEERLLFLGLRTVERLGCHGCHELAGFDGEPSIAPPLAALQRPGLAGDFEHPLADYALADEERRAVLTALAAHTARTRFAAGTVASTGNPAIDRGRTLIAQHQCRTCHVIEGEGDGLGPPLDGVGERLQASWIFDHIRAPEDSRVRTWLDLRMPRYDLTDAELNDLVRYFVERSSQLPLTTPPETNAQQRAVGRIVFDMLECGRCHGGDEVRGGTGPGEALASGGDDGGGDDGAEAAPRGEARAPSYALASERLRPAWVEAWILEPRRFDPHTAMPNTFEGADGLDSSFLVGSLDLPMFYTAQLRLARVYDDPRELEERLGDPQWVAAALRAHLWSLDPDQ